jgi:hypothetical protein
MFRRVLASTRACSVFGRRFFTDEQRKLLQDEKTFLGGLQKVVQDAGASENDVKVVQAARLQLDELFLVVVVGEFNAGKVL